MDDVWIIAARDRAAFGHWMARAEHSVRASLSRFAAAVDTEAIVQETFLRVWYVLHRVVPDGRPEPLLRLAFRTAHNLAISELRRMRRVAPTEEKELRRAADEQAEAAHPSAPDPLLRRIIAKCRELLPPQPRKALKARIDACGGTSDGVLAEQLGMRRNTFLQNVTRARTLLAGCLRSHGVELEGEGA
jgi:RNA polymerase sigma-70 factor (ECF subfamily)